MLHEGVKIPLRGEGQSRKANGVHVLEWARTTHAGVGSPYVETRAAGSMTRVGFPRKKNAEREKLNHERPEKGLPVSGIEVGAEPRTPAGDG